MAAGSSFLERIDSQLENLFAGWSIYTTILALVIVGYLIYPVLFTYDADTHPLLLARQASSSPIRQPGESATYRSLEVPYGYPLRTGLNVKDPGAAKWTSGRDGDLRDVWKKALEGVDGKKGRIISVMGKETFEHSLINLTRHINAIGGHLQKQDAKRVAICLPNSVEFLVAFFAAAYNGIVPILVPQHLSFETLADVLHSTNADILIAPAGTVPAEHLAMSCPKVKQAIWVVEETSRHMDFGVNPSKTQTAVEWHEIVGDVDLNSNAPSDLLSTGGTPAIICIYPRKKPTTYDVVEFSQKNIIAAIAAQIAAVPRNHKIGPSDLLMPLDSLTTIYTMVLTLAALFSGASIALTLIAGPAADYDSAFLGVSPTIIVASAQTMIQAHKEKFNASHDNWSKIQYTLQARALLAGRMNKPHVPGPRLIYISTYISANPQFLSSKQLHDLRVLTGARIVCSLTAAKVAGAISQTNAFDYRIQDEPQEPSHFGAPLSAVEIKVVDTPMSKISDDGEFVGHIVVTGPAVTGDEVNLGIMGRIRDDSTLALVFAS
ncbi:hypothetical protein MMC11_006228 [Xylographa trunciseda]|nr:hypothetical protein [Xylographa trunciseda]